MAGDCRSRSRRATTVAFVWTGWSTRHIVRRGLSVSCASWRDGVFAPKIHVIEDDDSKVVGGRGCVSAEPIPCGEAVVQVDFSAVLAVDVEEEKGLPWYIRMALRIVEESFRGKQSPFAGYMHLLQGVRDGEQSALFNTEVSRNLLWYRYLHDEIETYRQYTDEMYDSLVRDRGIEESTWRWALWIAHSRAFAIPPDGRSIALIPMVDMFNHTTRAASELVYDQTRGKLEIVFSHDLRAHEEVFITYGGLSNDILMPYFNFVEKDNPVDTFCLIWDSPQDLYNSITDLAPSSLPESTSHLSPDRETVLSELGFFAENGPFTARFGLDGPSFDVQMLLRVLCCQGSLFSATEPEKFRKHIGLETELKVWGAVERLLEAEMQSIRQQKVTQGSPAIVLDFANEKIRTIGECLRIVRWWRDVSERVGRVTTMLMPPGRERFPSSPGL